MNKVDWLTEFPAHWHELRADFLCDPYRITVSPGHFEGRMVAHYSIPQVQETGGPLVEPADDIDSLKLLITKPTLLVSKLNPRKRTVCIAEPQGGMPTLASGEFVPVQSNTFDQRYGYYLWLSTKVTDYLSAIVQSATRSHQRVNPADILKLPWKWPPLETQKRIAAFLDKGTAQLDELIEKKRALLERLVEKRQAIIIQTITKGLDPAVPMRDSGIDWIGRLPTHWEVSPLKRVLSYQEGPGIMAADFCDEGVALLRVASVGDRWATLNGVNYLDPELVARKWRHFLTQEGDLLISASATSGIVSEVRDDTAGCIPYTGIIRIKAIEGRSLQCFLRHFLVSRSFLSQIDQLKAGSTIQHFGPYHLGLMFLALPSVGEQFTIAKYLDGVLDKMHEIERGVRSSIECLAEYRFALITAAVTGQIEGLR